MKYDTICIFGSRTIDTDEHKDLIYNELSNYEYNWIITSGETSGVCELCRDIARHYKIPIKFIYASSEKFAAGKYEHRSMDILKQSDFVLFFWDGKSKGTKNEIKYAEKLNVPYKIIKVQVNDYQFETNINFNIEFNS